MLPRYAPLPVGVCREPFDHPEWIFELKLDGFRALAYVEAGRCQLVSRNRHVYRSERIRATAADVGPALGEHRAVLDGELVCLDDTGAPQFSTLLFRRAVPYFDAFDLLWLNGEDLTGLSLLERKRRLRADRAGAALAPAVP